jgi:SEC-C motif domain protein
MECPCGRTDARDKPLLFAHCCGPYLSGAPAPDAESLMRSRYTAFAMRDEAYLLATWHPSTRPRQLALGGDAKWLGLEVRAHRSLDAEHAEVEFVARYRQGGAAAAGKGAAVRIHERSRFVREGGRWYYLNGDMQ